MKDLKDQLNENIKDVNEARTNGYIEFEVYDRGMSNTHRKARFFAKDLYDALRKIVENVGLYITIDALDDPNEEYEFYAAPDDPKSKRDKMAKEILDGIKYSNGDGCDFITKFEWNGKTYIEEEGYEDEEVW